MPHGRPRNARPAQAKPAILARVSAWRGRERLAQRVLLAGTIGRMPDATETSQPRNPLHGMTLEAIVFALQARYGWAGLAERVPVRCFSHDASVASSLKFLRKTPWAREKVESLYLFMLRDERRAQRPPG